MNVSPFVRRMRMETSVDHRTGRVEPTWRMVPGECCESLAFQTAADMGVSDEVVRRSETLFEQLTILHPPMDTNGVGEVRRSIPGGGGGGTTTTTTTRRADVSNPPVDRGARPYPLSNSAPLEAFRDLLLDVAAAMPAPAGFIADDGGGDTSLATGPSALGDLVGGCLVQSFPTKCSYTLFSSLNVRWQPTLFREESM